MERHTIWVGGVPLSAEIAATPEERERGLMHQRELEPDDGMLFIFPRAALLSVWMLHCHIPLDVAFFDADRIFSNVVRMEPYVDPAVDTGVRAYSAGPSKYIVETNRGWFERSGLIAFGEPTQPIVLDLPRRRNW